MKQKILVKNGKYYAYLNDVCVGNSTHRNSAKNLIKYCLKALDQEKRIAYLEKRIRKIRNNVFNFENADVNLEKVKQELLRLRANHFLIDLKKLKAALKIAC
jgi:hypothetical protein